MMIEAQDPSFTSSGVSTLQGTTSDAALTEEDESFLGSPSSLHALSLLPEEEEGDDVVLDRFGKCPLVSD